MAKHEANQYYKDLVGEKFTGSYDGRGPIGTEVWTRIKSDMMKNDTMKNGLDTIDDKFEGKIWRGFHDWMSTPYRILYVKKENSTAKEMEKAKKFKIMSYNYFPRPGIVWKEVDKYKDKCGFYFIVDAD